MGVMRGFSFQREMLDTGRCERVWERASHRPEGRGLLWPLFHYLLLVSPFQHPPLPSPIPPDRFLQAAAVAAVPLPPLRLPLPTPSPSITHTLRQVSASSCCGRCSTPPLRLPLPTPSPSITHTPRQASASSCCGRCSTTFFQSPLSARGGLTLTCGRPM